MNLSEYDSSVSDGEDEKTRPSTSCLELERRDRSRGDGKIEAPKNKCFEATGSDEGTKNENTKKADEEFDFKVIGLEKVPPTSKSRFRSIIISLSFIFSVATIYNYV